MALGTGCFLLGGSWDLVTRVRSKVTIIIFAENPKILQVEQSWIVGVWAST